MTPGRQDQFQRHPIGGVLQEGKHRLGRAPKCCAIRGYQDGTLDCDRVGDHACDQVLIGQGGVVEAGFGSFPFAEKLARRQAEQTKDTAQLRGVGRCLEVFDNVRLDAACTQKFKGLARLAASGVVVEGIGQGMIPVVGLRPSWDDPVALAGEQSRRTMLAALPSVNIALRVFPPVHSSCRTVPPGFAGKTGRKCRTLGVRTS
jgi:hypothetical protein